MNEIQTSGHILLNLSELWFIKFMQIKLEINFLFDIKIVKNNRKRRR